MQYVLAASRDFVSFLASLQLVKDLADCAHCVCLFLKGRVKTERQVEIAIITICVLATLLSFSVCVYLMALAFQSPGLMPAVFWSTFFFLIYIAAMSVAYHVSK